MTTHITVHLLPHEIDWFEWQCKQLKLSSFYLNPEDTVILDATLNFNFTDWEESRIPKEFFENKFKICEELSTWADTRFSIDTEGKCRGCDDKRRETIRTTDADSILYLDTDLIFDTTLLATIIEASKHTPEECYIITPQIPKLWDHTWDVLVSSEFENQPYGFEKVVDPFYASSITGENSLKPLDTFKFGGGWFNLLSTKLLKVTDIPDSFGPYGMDDTYVMECCKLMQRKGMKVQQYVLEGTTVAENYKFRNNPYNSLLVSENKQNEYRQAAESNFVQELKNFNSSLK
jgi:hypothetical protein